MALQTIEPRLPVKGSIEAVSNSRVPTKKRGRDLASSASGSGKRRRLSVRDCAPDLAPPQTSGKESRLKERSHYIPKDNPWWIRCGRASEQEAIRAYYDSLPPIPPFRRALNEHNKRNEALNQRFQPSSQPIRPLKRENLVQPTRDLKRYARTGGPDLADLRGFDIVRGPSAHRRAPQQRDLQRMPTRKQQQAQEQQQAPEAPRSVISLINGRLTEKNSNAPSKKPTVYDHEFEHNLRRHRIFTRNYLDKDGKPLRGPSNLDIIKEVTNATNPSIMVMDDEQKAATYDRYETLLKQVCGEPSVREKLWSFFIPHDERPIYSTGGIPLKHIAPLTDGNITGCELDYFEGSARSELDWIYNLKLTPADEASLLTYLVPSGNPKVPVVPNFSAEYKTPDGSLDVASRQATYGGAIGARAMQKLRMLERPDDFQEYDRAAYSIAIIFNGHALYITSVHYAESKSSDSGLPDCITTNVQAFAVGIHQADFFQAIHAVKNLREWCRKLRNRFIDKARKRATRGMQEQTQPTPPLSVRSEDENPGNVVNDGPDDGQALVTSFAESHVSNVTASSAHSDDIQEVVKAPTTKKRRALSKQSGREPARPRRSTRLQTLEENN